MQAQGSNKRNNLFGDAFKQNSDMDLMAAKNIFRHPEGSTLVLYNARPDLAGGENEQLSAEAPEARARLAALHALGRRGLREGFVALGVAAPSTVHLVKRFEITHCRYLMSQ